MNYYSIKNNVINYFKEIHEELQGRPILKWVWQEGQKLPQVDGDISTTLNYRCNWTFGSNMYSTCTDL